MPRPVQSGSGLLVRLVPKKASPKSNTVVRLVGMAKGKPSHPPPGRAVASGDFVGKAKQLTVTYTGAKRTILVGVGELNALTPEGLRTAVAAAVAKCHDLKVTDAAFVLPTAVRSVLQGTTTGSGAPTQSCTLSLARTARLAKASKRSACETVSRWITMCNFRDVRYKSKPEEFVPLKRVALVLRPTRGTDGVAAAQGCVVGEAANTAKELGNLRPDVGTPDYYAAWVEKLCKRFPSIKLRHHLKGEELARKGLNMHYNVGKGAQSPPHLLVLEYVGNPKNDRTLALVGKGVTFDTGGLHVKGFGFMEDMHLDMMGAATVLATLEAVARLRLKANLVVAVGFAENAIGSKAYKPSTILTSLKGTTVEILNTDAEGRLVLGDALTFVQEKAKVRKPTDIIDVATLTGAIIIALGSHRGGLFSNSDKLRDALYDSGVATAEPLWPMPVGPEHEEKIKGTLSDLKNIGEGRDGGSCTAAAFLKHFINPGVRWAHLDIAGAGMNDKLPGTQPKGAPGFGVALLVDYIATNMVTKS